MADDDDDDGNDDDTANDDTANDDTANDDGSSGFASPEGDDYSRSGSPPGSGGGGENGGSGGGGGGPPRQRGDTVEQDLEEFDELLRRESGMRAQNEAAALAFAAAAVGENEAGSPVPEARLDENSATRLHQLRNKYADHSQQFIGHKKHSRGVPGFNDPFGQQEPEESMALSRSVRALDLEGLERNLQGRQIDAHWSLEDSLW